MRVFLVDIPTWYLALFNNEGAKVYFFHYFRWQSSV
jgi:hypothetical protein